MPEGFGQQSDAAIVLTTLALTASFTPLKNALQGFADKRFKEVPDATRKLRAAATRLLTMGETALAQAAEQEATRIEQSGEVSPEGAKELRYATRKLAVRDD